MPKILALNCATQSSSVALLVDKKLISRVIDNDQKASSFLLPSCAKVLKEACISLSDIDLIAYTKGPGTFTGVRMCVSVAQGLSLGLSLPVQGFSTLLVLAYGAKKYLNTNKHTGLGKILVAIDARMEEVYWGIYENGQLITQALSKPDKLPHLGKETLGIGNAWLIYANILKKTTGISKYLANIHPSANDLAKLSLSYYHKKQHLEALALPNYLRNQVANKMHRD